MDLKQKSVGVYNEGGSIMEKSDVPERMMNEWRGIYRMQGDKTEPCWEEERRTHYHMDEYMDRTTIELTSREAEDYQDFTV